MIKTSLNHPTQVAAGLTSKVEITLVTDPKEIADFQLRQERFDRNADWLQAHGAEIYSKNRGKYLCIAGQELFAADTALEALALAQAAHPDDDGRFLHFVPKEKLPLIYAH